MNESLHRILVIDDNPAIHEDFRKILAPPKPGSAACEEEEALLFGRSNTAEGSLCFEIDSALQGQEGLELVRKSLEQGRPYALAFVDVRMPPGWDGVETITRLWDICPELQIVICTAYSDYSWEDITIRFGHSDSMLILKKPFDKVAVLQMAHALVQKWVLTQESKSQVSALQLANQKLTREMAERSKLEAQLRQAQKMEAIGQLAAGVAHDFNNLLTVIQGHVSLLLMQRELDQDVRSSLKQTLSAGERAGNLTRQLLAFSRKQAMEQKPLRLSKLFDQLGGLLQRLIGEQVEVEFTCPPTIPPVYADLCNLEQVMMNLAVNARDAMPRGGHLKFSAEAVTVSKKRAASNPEAAAGKFVRLSVKDTGCGMDEPTRARIFEPFFTTKEPGKGTGMGLATVYGIVKQHKGWIELESEVGRGTTFHIYLPMSDQLTDTGLLHKTELEAACCRGDETILVVEDEAFVRYFVQTVLESNGYKILLAGNAAEALEVWKENSRHISLVLTDMIMPGGVTGKELVEKLIKEKPDLRVIFTSGYNVDVLRNDLHLCSGYSLLQKPYQAHALAATVRQCLGAKTGADRLVDKELAAVANF